MGVIENPPPLGALVSLTFSQDRIWLFTHNLQFVYERLDPSPLPIRFVLDEGPIPWPAVLRLHAFKQLIHSQPDLLRTVGIAGCVWLDRLLDVHRY